MGAGGFGGLVAMDIMIERAIYVLVGALVVALQLDQARALRELSRRVGKLEGLLQSKSER